MVNRIAILLLVIWNNAGIVAQSNADSLFASLNERLSVYPSEQIYLQTSKGIYETGEDLWFKA